MSEKPDMKAYLVDCDQENGAQLYFARTANQAKCYAANDAGCDYIEVGSCRRQPQFDEYAPGPVPPKVMIENGWWFECFGCSRRVAEDMDDYADDDDDGGTTLDGPIYRNNAVWCSTACQSSWDKQREAERLANEEAKAACLLKWPKARNVTASMRGSGKRCAEFDFGGKIKALWEIGDTKAWVAPIDMEIWEAFAREAK